MNLERSGLAAVDSFVFCTRQTSELSTVDRHVANPGRERVRDREGERGREREGGRWIKRRVKMKTTSITKDRFKFTLPNASRLPKSPSYIFGIWSLLCLCLLTTQYVCKYIVNRMCCVRMYQSYVLNGRMKVGEKK